MILAADSPALEIRALTRRFGEREAVSGLDLVVPRGEMFGLVGPDGAGKSTAIRLLCGILKPDAGEGRVLGFDLVRDAGRIKSRIGYLSQNFTLYGDLTVDENIEFFADLHGVRGFAERRNELLEFTRLTPFRRRLAQALSGGMKKKLALATTLIHRPDLLFLDEPSTGVDPVSRGEFWNILSGVLNEGMTIVMTTPYLDEAERCGRIGLMHNGRLFMSGTPDEVKAAMPGRVYEVTCPAPAPAYRALRRRWSSSNVVLYGDHLRLSFREGEPVLREALALLEGEGYGPVGHREVAPSLEDAFVALLGEGNPS
ncbi:MAG: ABC transporter ATP-binding protein [Verrucomicrobia bacterium]|nr:ABC transporter ATP-binding protein [Verrucomicrobiota bacterium]MBU1909516.1 ABC transporter ATP-binding protein [Verrucomicrobiota bacterium]